MKWDHRVVKFSGPNETVFEFKEVYYVNEKPVGYCDVNLSFDDRSDAFVLVHRLEDALDKAFLEASELNKEK